MSQLSIGIRKTAEELSPSDFSETAELLRELVVDAWADGNSVPPKAQLAETARVLLECDHSAANLCVLYAEFLYPQDFRDAGYQLTRQIPPCFQRGLAKIIQVAGTA
ncbi:MAG: hypothetical protein NT076_05275 [Candidatus Pacearchaeota archaeon]|nr:hypothetical protein [Candidatus Pacearchaeota archaeon]